MHTQEKMARRRIGFFLIDQKGSYLLCLAAPEWIHDLELMGACRCVWKTFTRWLEPNPALLEDHFTKPWLQICSAPTHHSPPLIILGLERWRHRDKLISDQRLSRGRHQTLSMRRREWEWVSDVDGRRADIILTESPDWGIFSKKYINEMFTPGWIVAVTDSSTWPV